MNISANWGGMSWLPFQPRRCDRKNLNNHSAVPGAPGSGFPSPLDTNGWPIFSRL
jgi:hypothetical protein